jgi:hypothetical protein
MFRLRIDGVKQDMLFPTQWDAYLYKNARLAVEAGLVIDWIWEP